MISTTFWEVELIKIYNPAPVDFFFFFLFPRRYKVAISDFHLARTSKKRGLKRRFYNDPYHHNNTR